LPVFTLPAVVKGVSIVYGAYFAIKTVYGIFVDPDAGHHPIIERAGLVVAGVVRRANPLALTFTIVEQGVMTVLELAKDSPEGGVVGATVPPMWQRDP